MTKDKDYRNTEYCSILENVDEKKQELEKQIKKEHPRLKIVYNKVRDRNDKYHKKFAKIYNDKCAYCGSLWGLLPVESFQIDHYINEGSFPHTTEGRAEAGKIKNLVWSCVSCNQGKRGLTIIPPYDDILNTDNGNITNVFLRDQDYYIQVCDTYQEDEFVQKFYKSLHLDYEARRLDYLCLQLQGKYLREKDEKQKSKWSECLSILLQKRNREITAGGC